MRLVDRFSPKAGLHIRRWLVLPCILALAVGCDKSTNAVPEDSEVLLAEDDENSPPSEKANKEEPKLEPKDVPQRLLEPAVQELVHKIEAWGGTVDAELGKLITINLDNTRIDDGDLGEISQAQDVQELSLNNTLITDRGLTELANLKSLRQLHCAGTKVSDAGMKSIAKLTELWSLRLSRTNIGDEGVKELAPLKKLDILSLDETRLTNAGLPTLVEFPLLKSVNLSSTKINDAGLESLSRLKAVEILYLEKTGLSDKGIQQLRAALGVRTKIFAHDGTFKP